MRISEIHIDRYGPIRGFSHTCEDNFEVFFGPNESGKTFLLESVLKLLSPDIENVLPSVSRVGDHPTGHIYLETEDGEQQLGDGTELEDISDIRPRHLRNVFVVRDSDLELQNEHTFYDSITQRIGDLHTDEISAIQSEFVDRGRLTSLDGRGLSHAEGNDNAEYVRDDAAELAEDIREYIEQATEAEVAASEREFLSVKAELNRCEEELAVQEQAETLDRHDTLSRRLHTYREALQSLDEDFSRDTLEHLRDLDRQVRDADDEIDDLEDRRDRLREEQTALETELEEVRAELTPYEDRLDEVEELERDLESFRESKERSLGASREMDIAKYAALVGLLLGGAGAVLGSTIAGIILTAIGVISLGWYWLQSRSIRAVELECESLLARAQDAGFEVSSVDEIGPAIQEVRDTLTSLEERRDALDNEISVKENLFQETAESLESERDERRENQDELNELLQQAGVGDIDEYRNRVEAKEEIEGERDSAAQSLADALGEPDAEATSPERRIEYWESELEGLIADVDDSVSAETYDSERLDELRDEREELESRHQGLAEELGEHERRLEEFNERIQSLSAQPFLGEPITLESRTVEGLREIVPDLERLIYRIELNADVAREALDIFDDLKAREEQKITDLFGDNSRATEVFQRITGGRYESVSYDSSARVLKVRRDGGDVYTPADLSHGAKTQLYLAARVGLAEQLLPAEPGFFLMDDAFLPADGNRLREGFEVLQELASDGWQVLYFSAKDEVGEDVVEEADLRCSELETLQ